MVDRYLEDMFEGVLRRSRNAEHAKVSEEPGRDGVSSSSWRSTRRADRHVLDLFPEQFFSIVEPVEVLVLSQQLDGWLRTVRVQLWHVEIIDENHDLLPSGCA